MKKHNKFFFSAILFTSLSLSANANAFEFNVSTGLDAGKSAFGKVLKGAKKGLDKGLEIVEEKAEEAKKVAEEAKKAAEEAQKLEEAKKNKLVADSKVEISIAMPADARHAMIVIAKKDNNEDYKENVVVDIDQSALNKTIYLRAREGVYNLKIFQTSSVEKYGVPYSYVTELNVTNSDTRDLSFLLPSEEVQSNDERIKQIAEELTADVSSDAAKIRKIHDYVAENIEYDWQAYRDGSYVNNPTDALSVLDRGLTVCEGYSKLFAAIARAAGIRVAVIHGKALVSSGFGDHAWNEVMINGEWKIVDVTWDDMKELRYDYFFPSPAKFATDHRREKAMIEY